LGYNGSSDSPWNHLFKISMGEIIVAALGFMPGYYASTLTVEILGRKWIPLQGFMLAGLFHVYLLIPSFLGILVGCFHMLSKAAFIIRFSFLQFFNLSANTTAYMCLLLSPFLSSCIDLHVPSYLNLNAT
ncbi:hypothetical protein BDN70DRAFT_818921, partial [Pholiota conissans]